MGIIGQIIDLLRAEVSGGRKVKYYKLNAGCATEPIKGDDVLLVRPQAGSHVAVGFADPKAPELKAGESMIYSRSVDGGVKSWAIVSPDGTAEISNGLGSLKVAADGSVDINGVTIDPLGNIKALTVTESITNVSLGLHVHTSFGTPPTPGV